VQYPDGLGAPHALRVPGLDYPSLHTANRNDQRAVRADWDHPEAGGQDARLDAQLDRWRGVGGTSADTFVEEICP